MLSIGIRCGLGFDKSTLASLIETGKRPYEYDVLILGANPGGLACAEEAVKSGRKTAVVSWRVPTPGEDEGHDEDKCQMLEALEMDERSIRERTYALLDQEGKTELMPAIKFPRFVSSKVSQVELRNEQRHSKWSRKIRRSRIDFRNAFTDLALEGIWYMHEMAVMRDFVLSKNTSSKSQVISWGKMMENLLDYIIERRWHVLTGFIQSKINIYSGHPISIGNHSVRIATNDCERVITAETIITAAEAHYSFPSDVVGSREFGINITDFSRLFLSPGKTLIVGGNHLGLSCAGILASFGFPVTLVYRGTLLKGGDSEIVTLIVRNLQSKGVKFMEKQLLTGIQKNKAGDALMADFVPLELKASNIKKKYSEEFDTVLFTTIEKPNTKKSGKSRFQIEYERLAGKLCSAEEVQALQIYIDIPDKSTNEAATKLFGKHIGQKLFGTGECRLSNFNLIPNNVLTPIEYAYVGASEHIAITRLGEECVEIYKGYFQTEDVISGASSSKSEVCYAKVISVRKSGQVVGLHLFGRDAVQIMDKILEPIAEIITISNLHPAIRNLLKADDTATTSDAGEF